MGPGWGQSFHRQNRRGGQSRPQRASGQRGYTEDVAGYPGSGAHKDTLSWESRALSY